MSRALDPQLHTHVVAANLTRGPDGRFTALHGAALYRAAKTAGYLYQAHLRALVTERLGLEWGEVRKGAAELAEIERPVVEQFSQRRHEMLRAAERRRDPLGVKGAAERRRSRPASASSTGSRRTPGARRSRARAGEHGLGREEDRRAAAGGPASGWRTVSPSTAAWTSRRLARRLAGAGGLDGAREHLR